MVCHDVLICSVWVGCFAYICDGVGDGVGEVVTGGMVGGLGCLSYVCFCVFYEKGSGDNQSVMGINKILTTFIWVWVV